MKKVVVIGPESTGKSTLTQQLAAHYNTAWCPEFAREYLKANGTDYSFEDLLNIARGQVILEDNILMQATNGIYFIDTDMYVMKVWCEVAFNNCHTWILKQIVARNYDLIFLCDVDLPWIQDDLREYPDLAFRKKLFKMYKELLISQNTKWAVVSGNYAQRLQAAISIVDTVFRNKFSKRS